MSRVASTIGTRDTLFSFGAVVAFVVPLLSSTGMNVLRHNFLRQVVVRVPSRAFSTTRIRFEALADSEIRPIPQSPSFYTTRAVYYDQLAQLEKTIISSEGFLRRNHLLPLPDFARASLPELHPMWKDQSEMASSQWFCRIASKNHPQSNPNQHRRGYRNQIIPELTLKW